MTVPPALVGAWRRSGLLLDGVRQLEHCDVLWLQAPEWFTDVRLRLDPTVAAPAAGAAAVFATEWAFAGTASYTPPVLTWTHLLDSRPEPGQDASPVGWEGGVLVERGTVRVDGREVAFVEEWLRLSDEEPTVETSDRQVRLSVGRWAVDVRDGRPAGVFLATRLELRDGDWTEVGTVRG